ncbi:CPBP family intramembrane glutamic endopeptidase [Streptomyces sp. NPDC058304]|uniref:CPBP family intramembrane glutamic endopeptidase n=1 Tax=Streptomyces sp. NPDC058304 TaxID=3346437 RepID=UPI0036E6D116
MGTVGGVEPAERAKASGTAAVFTAVAFVAAGVLGAVQPDTGVPPEVVQLTQFGPAVGVGAVALYRRRQTRELLRGGGGGERRTGRAVALLATAGLIVALSVLAYWLASGDVGFTRPGALHHPFVLIAAAQLVGACGEEVGWRCFLQPLLRTRFGTVVSSMTVGAVWGAWHVPVFAQAPAYAAGFLVATVAMSVVLGVALDGTGGTYRLLLAGGFHALVNLGLLLFMDVEFGAALPMVCFGLACLLAGLVWAGRQMLAPRALMPFTKPRAS